jgi:hypothetical protein
MAAPEYYWFDGEDMGAGGAVNTDHTAMNPSIPFFPFLNANHFLPCYQSGTKLGRDDHCSCRDTIYEKLAHVHDGDERFLDMFDQLFTKYIPPHPSDLLNTIPTFSIEQLGPALHWDQFSVCVNTQNFHPDYIPAGSSRPGLMCGADTKCQPACGVANIFGNWTELCFKSFLDKFVATYGYSNVMIYDAGFLPQAWMPAGVTLTSLDPKASKPSDTVSGVTSCSDFYNANSQDFCNTTAPGTYFPSNYDGYSNKAGFCFCEDGTTLCASETSLPTTSSAFSSRFRSS